VPLSLTYGFVVFYLRLIHNVTSVVHKSFEATLIRIKKEGLINILFVNSCVATPGTQCG